MSEVKEALVLTGLGAACAAAALPIGVAHTTVSTMADDYIDDHIDDPKMASVVKVLTRCGILMGTCVVAYRTGDAIGTITAKILNN